MNNMVSELWSSKTSKSSRKKIISGFEKVKSTATHSTAKKTFQLDRMSAELAQHSSYQFKPFPFPEHLNTFQHYN